MLEVCWVSVGGMTPAAEDERKLVVRLGCYDKLRNKLHFVSIREVGHSECVIKAEVTTMVLVYLHGNSRWE